MFKGFVKPILTHCVAFTLNMFKFSIERAEKRRKRERRVRREI